jgi:hypothetical protein
LPEIEIPPPEGMRVAAIDVIVRLKKARWPNDGAEPFSRGAQFPSGAYRRIGEAIEGCQ